jgi:non-homologous end joining protein Ku
MAAQEEDDVLRVSLEKQAVAYRKPAPETARTATIEVSDNVIDLMDALRHSLGVLV